MRCSQSSLETRFGAAYESALYKHQDFNRGESSHRESKRSLKVWIAGEAVSKLSIVLIVQVFFILSLSCKSGRGDDDVILVRRIHYCLPVERPIFISPQPGHVGLRETLRYPK